MEKLISLSNLKTFWSSAKSYIDNLVGGKADKSAIPTKLSQLTNDASYAKKSELPTVPTKLSAFTNDKNFITASDIAAATETEITSIFEDK